MATKTKKKATTTRTVSKRTRGRCAAEKKSSAVQKSANRKTSAKPETAVRKSEPNPFQGAKEISITQNAISVTHGSAKSVKGQSTRSERTIYYPKTAQNMQYFEAAANERGVKKVTIRMK